MDAAAARAFIERVWDEEIVPELTDYIRIPNKSPAFDPDWAAHGHMDAGGRRCSRPGRARKIDAIDGRARSRSCAWRAARR